MSEDLQALLDRIRSDGVEKAAAEAKSITDAARKEAEAIRQAARDDAAKTREEAKRDAADFAAHAEATVKQAMRDVKLQLAADLQRQVTDLLAADVKAAFADKARVSEWVAKAVDAYLREGEGGIAVELGGSAAAMAESLRGALAAKAAAGGVEVTGSPAFPEGFTLRLDGGRVEQCFTAQAVTDALSRLLRPELAAMLKDA